MNLYLPDLTTVLRRESEAVDTVTLTLGAGTVKPEPGQFYMLHVFGVGEVPISVSAIGDDHSAFTIRSVGKVSEALTKLDIGDTVGIRGPFGSGWPIASSPGKDVLIVAGGLGLAPLRPLLAYIEANRKRFGKVWLLYGTRCPSDILYPTELKRLSETADIQVLVSVNIATAEWKGVVGVVTALLHKVSFNTKEVFAYVCGPEIMMHYTVLELKKRGLSQSQIFLSLERNMHCALGHCGRCMLGPEFLCKDGPVFPYEKIASFFETREI